MPVPNPTFAEHLIIEVKSIIGYSARGSVANASSDKYVRILSIAVTTL